MNNPDAIPYLQISKRSSNIIYLAGIYIIAAVLLISGVGKINNPIPLVVLALLAIFIVYSVYGTIMGINSDCGCFGSVNKSEIGWGMVIRNIYFFY